ncbi:hypothetical protein [Enterobacter mori]|nr:hypothetical protein [Enterobacter mori]
MKGFDIAIRTIVFASLPYDNVHNKNKTRELILTTQMGGFF